MYREALLTDVQDSAFCLKVRICLQLKEVPYRRVAPSALDLLAEHALPRLQAVDGTVLTAAAILDHVEARYPQPSLVPAEPGARIYSDLLEDWADASLGAAARALAWGPPEHRAESARLLAREVTPPFLAPALRAAVAWRAARATTASDAAAVLDRHLRVLDALLNDRVFLLGRTLTRPDVAAFAPLACLRHLDGEPRLDAHPTVAAWFARLAAIPAVAAALVP